MVSPALNPTIWDIPERKSFLPSRIVQNHETNHQLAMSTAPVSGVEGNPVHEDMMDALNAVRKEDILHTDDIGQTPEHHKAVSGDLNMAFAKAVEYANEVFSVAIPRKSMLSYPSRRIPRTWFVPVAEALDGKWALKKADHRNGVQM